jgi:hypothetical protein
VTYALYWELENENVHGQATKSGLEKYYKRFTRCLTTIRRGGGRRITAGFAQGCGK